MIGIILAVMLVGGIVSGAIAAGRGVQPAFAYFMIGLLLPLVGIIVAAVVQPSAPAGTMRVRCPRCGATTNVQKDAPGMRCWRCGLMQGHVDNEATA